MKRFAGILIFLLLAINGALAVEIDSISADTIVGVDSDSIIKMDSDSIQEDLNLRGRISRNIKNVKAKIIKKAGTDSLKEKDNYWKWALVRGKLDLKDETIKYPKFMRFCVDVYNWADRTFNSYDSAYVVGTGKKWKLIAKNDNWVDNYDLIFPSGTHIRMLSNVCCNVGAYLSYMAVSVGYMFDAGYVFDGQPVSHKKWDFQFSCALFSADMQYTTNTGSTVIRRFGNYAKGKWINYPFSAMNAESYGIDACYYFNNKKYSQGAAYSYSKYQKRSAGSLITGITISSQDVSMDFSELNNEMIAQLPKTDNLYFRFKYFDYALIIGYGYNWVLSKHWLINVTGLPSLGVKHCQEESEDGRTELFSANIKAKVAAVYNHKQLFAAFSGKADMHWYSSKQYNFFNAVEYFNFCVGLRF